MMNHAPVLTLLVGFGFFFVWLLLVVTMLYSISRVDSWISRELCDASFELPRAYRVIQGDQRFDRSQPWSQLEWGHNGSSIYSLITDDGLALEVRSRPFPFPMMRTVCVPWSSVRVEISPRVTREWTVQILYPEGSVARSFTIDRYDRQWREAVSRQLARFQQAPVTYSPDEGRT